MSTHLLPRLAALTALLTAPLTASAQAFPELALANRVERDCGGNDPSVRLRSEHPLGATGSVLAACAGAASWVPTSPLSDEQRRAWRTGLDRLTESPMAECRRAGALLHRLERDGLVSVWTAVDTAGGMVYYGAAYVTPREGPLAVQFWAPTFKRHTDWLVAALAHEGFHALEPEATEADAGAFGAECAATGRSNRITANASFPAGGGR